jgi:hypothetical protein
MWLAMTACHAASQRARAVFPDRKAGFAKYTTCAQPPLELTAAKVRNLPLVGKYRSVETGTMDTKDEFMPGHRRAHEVPDFHKIAF